MDTTDPRLIGVWSALDEAKEMAERGPDAFKTGQDHLAPAFREVNWRDAFNAVARIVDTIESVSGYEERDAQAVAPMTSAPGAVAAVRDLVDRVREAALIDDVDPPDWTDEVLAALGDAPGARAAERFDCGHLNRTPGCGGCDPGAIEFVITDLGVRRPFDPVRDMADPVPSDHQAEEDRR